SSLILHSRTRMAPTDPGVRRQRNEEIARLYQQGRYNDALPLARQAAEGEGPPDPDRAASLEHLGSLLRELGHYSQAEAPLLQALSLRAQTLGKAPPDYARSLGSLGLLYEELAQYNQAEPIFRRALAIRVAALGEDHADVAESEYDLAQLLDLVARYPEAE